MDTYDFYPWYFDRGGMVKMESGIGEYLKTEDVKRELLAIVEIMERDGGADVVRFAARLREFLTGMEK